MKPGDKLYYIDYEQSKASYTIMSTVQSEGNKDLPDGNYYMIKVDSAKTLKTYPLPVKAVDRRGSKYFTTPEKAAAAYVTYRDDLRKRGIKPHFG